MRKRRQNQQGDSFDLFLDTITNTFGGVLLIALLIVLMIRENTDGAPKDHQAGPSEAADVIQSDIDALEVQKDSLTADLRDQKIFDEDFIDDGLEELSDKLSEKIRERNRLETKAAELSGAVKKASISRSGLAARGEQVKNDLEERTAEFEKLNKQLNAEEVSRTRTMSLPKEQQTAKDEVAMFFESNQLFVVHSNLAAGTINTRHFEETEEKEGLSIGNVNYRPKAGSGFPIGSGELKAALEQYSASDNYFAFVVRSNSFDQFSKLRSICVELGYEYRIIASDGVISQGGNGGSVQ